jgi:maltose alpha-D-glucosyltransferase / alpha-amylase
MASKSPPSDALAAWIAAQRWFAGKTRRITALTVEDRVPVGDAVVLVVGLTLDDGTTHGYAVPLRAGGDVADALDDPGYGRALLDLVAAGGHARGERGEITGRPTREFPRDVGRDAPVRRLGGEQSNTSIVLADRLVLKHFRRLVPGRNPEEEVGRFLTERTSFRHAPRLAGHLEYRRDGETSALAVLHELAVGADDGWRWMLDELRRVYDRLAASAGEPHDVQAIAGSTLEPLRRLGVVTAEMHLALAAVDGGPAFSPEPITPEDIASWAHAVERQLREAHQVLDRAGGEEDARAGRARAALDARLGSLGRRGIRGALGEGLAGLVGRVKIRHHGDFHLGQTLYRSRTQDWLVIDFEGEPLRPLAERRAKHAALRDVAGMLRSLDYAALSAAPPIRDRWARVWERAASAAFVDGYAERAAGAPFVPASGTAFTRAVAVFLVEKAAYEVVYEASHRPDWLAIPLGGLTRALSALTAHVHPGAA